VEQRKSGERDFRRRFPAWKKVREPKRGKSGRGRGWRVPEDESFFPSPPPPPLSFLALAPFFARAKHRKSCYQIPWKRSLRRLRSRRFIILGDCECASIVTPFYKPTFDHVKIVFLFGVLFTSSSAIPHERGQEGLKVRL